MFIPDNIEFLSPWEALAQAEDGGLALLCELERELALNEHHPLTGLKFEVCAHRIDRDDISVSTDDAKSHSPLCT